MKGERGVDLLDHVVVHAQLEAACEDGVVVLGVCPAGEGSVVKGGPVVGEVVKGS